MHSELEGWTPAQLTRQSVALRARRTAISDEAVRAIERHGECAIAIVAIVVVWIWLFRGITRAVDHVGPSLAPCSLLLPNRRLTVRAHMQVGGWLVSPVARNKRQRCMCKLHVGLHREPPPSEEHARLIVHARRWCSQSRKPHGPGPWPPLTVLTVSRPGCCTPRDPATAWHGIISFMGDNGLRNGILW